MSPLHQGRTLPPLRQPAEDLQRLEHHRRPAGRGADPCGAGRGRSGILSGPDSLSNWKMTIQLTDVLAASINRFAPLGFQDFPGHEGGKSFAPGPRIGRRPLLSQRHHAHLGQGRHSDDHGLVIGSTRIDQLPHTTRPMGQTMENGAHRVRPRHADGNRIYSFEDHPWINDVLSAHF